MPYTFGYITDGVLDDLNDPSFNRTRVDRYVNHGLNAIFNTHMFKFCEKAVVSTLTIGEYAYNQQDDHQATIGGSVTDETTGTTFQLSADNYLGHREFFERYGDPASREAGLPECWTEFGNELLFDKPVDKAYTFKQRYYRTPTELTLSADVPDLPPSFRELLEFYALYRAEKYRGNHDVAATYKQDFEDGLESMVLRYAEVQQVGPVVMGSNRVAVSL